MKISGFGQQYKNIKRYRQIIAVLLKYGFQDVLDRLRIYTYLGLGRRLIFRKKVEIEKLTYAQRIRLAMEELGPSFVKLGQILSMRPFLIPLELVEELAKLQDDVAPFPFETVKKIVERELKAPLEKNFYFFDPNPIASASLAQVHKAVTQNGDKVVVKVQRPDIKKIIDSDMNILKDLANLFDRYIPESRQYDPKGMIEELSKTFRREIDFKNEGRNIDIFAENFKEDKTVFVPKVFWDLSTNLVLTMEFIDGVKISNLQEIERRGWDRKIIARNAGKAVFKQIFIDGFFHADPHPGNIFVLENNVIAPVDFGMMGKLSETAMDEMSDLLIAVVTWDAKAVVKVYDKAGILGEGVNLKALEADFNDFMYRYHKIPLSRLDMKTIINDLFYIVHRYEIQVQSELMLLGRALSTYEEVARMLDPDFNFINEAIPFVRKLAKRKYKPKIILRDFLRGVHDLRDFLVGFPYELRRITQKIGRGELSFTLQHRGLEKLILELDRASNRISFSLVVAAIIVGSSLIMRMDVGPYLFGYPVLGIVGYVMAGFLGVWLVIAILRSGRM
jgi:ubiquinone biosynthesis protein